MGWAMRSCSSLDVSRHRALVLNLVCVLAMIFASLCANAQTPNQDADEPTASAAQPKDTAAPEARKKTAKYDITRIGSRGIGHGFNFYSLKRERQLGESLAAAIDSSSKIVNDPVLNDYVNRVAQKLVRNSDAEVPFTVRLIDSGEIPRAYGLPGGFLYIDSSLIFASESEAELAGVMAHEIAHVAARHATRALTRKNLCDLTSNTLTMLTGPFGMIVEDANGFAGPLSVKKFSRDAEYEADLLGIEYAYSAGYDPEALLAALEKLHAIEVNRSGALASIPGYHLVTKLPFHQKIARGFANYPQTEERIRRLQSEIATFLPDRKEYIVDTNEFQEIKSRLLSMRLPLQLRRHGGDEDPRAPVLRRTPQQDAEPAPGNLRNALTLIP